MRRRTTEDIRDRKQSTRGQRGFTTKWALPTGWPSAGVTCRCPNETKWTAKAEKIDYFGVMGGGDTSQRVTGLPYAGGGDIFDNRLFVENRSMKPASVTNGASKTLAIGEGSLSHLGYGGGATESDSIRGIRG